MLKIIVVLISLLALTACKHNYAEDENYVYIKKDDIICKLISEEVIFVPVSRGSGTSYLYRKSKCMFLKEEKLDYSKKDIERKKQLEKELGV